MPFDCTDPRGWNSGPDPAPACWALLAAYASVWRMYGLLMALCAAVAIVTGEWINGGGVALQATFLFAPFRLHLSRDDLRALAVGRWP